MRSKILGLAVLTLLGVALAPAPAQANHAWGSYHWARTANPFTLNLGDNVSGTWDSALATASTDWSKSTVLDTVIVPGSSTTKTCKGTPGMVQVCNASYGSNGWLGIASISISGGHITQGVVKLNDTYFNTATYNTPEWRALVTCQEVGHTFGLGHQDENFNNKNLDTCMDYTNSPTSNQHPNSHDYDQLVTIYSHLDSTTTVGTSTAAPKSRLTVGNSSTAWGRLVEGSRADGHSTYVRQDASGNVVVTHVLWA